MAEEKVVYFDEFKRDAFKEKVKRKVDEAKEKAKEAAIGIVGFTREHPAEAVAIFTATAAVTKKGLQYKKVKAEDRRRLVDFYDPRCGRHSTAKRPLTRKESLRAQRMYDADKNARWSEILNDMGLLKH